MADNPLMTTVELAAKLNVSTDTVRRMCNSGEWPHVRIGRLYRFTEGHYQAIIAPPPAPVLYSPETIARALRSLSS